MTSAAEDPLRERVATALGERFALEGELGRGGSAVVYVARDVRLRRRVALKVLPPELAFRAGVRERFLREAQTAAQLSHPNVVPIYAADDTQGIAWLAMALVEGETLGRHMARVGPAPIDEARRILAQVADALAYAHAHGVVHRDVKPDNVLLDRESGRALVTDFGIARAAEEGTKLTATGIAVGTPAYMSPEQAMGDAEVDGRSDLYALGVVGYQLLTGVLPFESPSATGMLMKHVGEAPRPVRERRPEVPALLAEAIERALAKKPTERWPDAAAFRRALLDPRAGEAFGGAPAPPAAAPRETPTLAAPVPAAAPRAIPPDRAAPGRPTRNGARIGLDAGGVFPLPAGPLSGQSWREARRAWKEQQRDERRELREQARAARDEWREHLRDARGDAGLPVPVVRGDVPGAAPLGGMPGAARVPAGYPPGAYPADGFGPGATLPLERRAELFRRKAIGSLLLIGFLAVINGIHLFIPPWVVFPAWGILGDLRRRWRPLEDEGLRFWELVWEGPQAAIAGARTRPDARLALAGPEAQVAVRRVRRLRRRRSQAMTFAALAGLFLFIGATTNAEPLIVPFVVFAVLAAASGVGALRTARALRRQGVPSGAALRGGWETSVAALDPRPREALLRDEAARLASADVLAGPHGAALRGALDDRQTVRDTLARLSTTDRALIPDVTPTVDALVERIAGLVQSLSRIDADVRPGQLEALDARIAEARSGAAGSADRERTVGLLERQRTSLADLLQRRATLQGQLEHAQLVLQNVKLDLLKLRSAGVGALAEVTSATQAARALSRDIQYALEAAAEVRKSS